MSKGYGNKQCRDIIPSNKCLPGTYSIENTTVCKSCDPGAYTVELGATKCIICPPGSMCPVANQLPIVCPINTFSSGGSTGCKACSKGMIADSGSSKCLTCPPGYRCSAAGNKVCKAGTFNTGSQTGCQICGFNEISPDAASRCKACKSNSNHYRS